MHLRGLDRNLVFAAHGRRHVLVQVRELERPVGVHMHRCVPI
jgi:hypothetical protein